jgi:uncharacterized LabA/DUF88 family protein
MKVFTYVDNSNVYIEGSRVSAVRRGMAPSIYDAMNNNIVDRAWKMDYGRLHQFLCGTDKAEIGAARLWGSPPPGDSFWEMVKRQGFAVETFAKSAEGREKKVDVAIAQGITKDAYTCINRAEDQLVLVSGDKDFVPVIADLVNEGYTVKVAFWNHAAQELKNSLRNSLPTSSLSTHIFSLSHSTKKILPLN